MSSRISLCVTRTALALLLALGAAIPDARAQADVQGQWSTANYSMTINPIHVALMHNGKILVTTGSGNCPASQPGCPSGPPYGGGNHSGAVVVDPVAQVITQLSIGWDIFCNGMTVLPDGRVFIVGGTIAYDPFEGSQKSTIFDPSSNSFTDQPNMAHGRWYPTPTLLSDGRVMVFSGFDETNATNNTVEIYTVGSGWSQQYTASWTPPLYPRQHLLPNGNVFVSGPAPTTYTFNPSNQSWAFVDSTNLGATRTYGSSVLLPLTPANNYDPKVLILGGGTTATTTTELIDMGASSPSWAWGPDMSQPRVEMDAVLLPTGKILATGGSATDENAATASLNADLYDPATNSFSSAGANTYARLYHSVALLLPDATVWTAGSNPARGTWEPHMEIYKPPYLFTRDGNNNVVAATRPTIASAPTNIGWGGAFTVSTPDAASILQAVLVRPGASTHSFDMDQRLVGMSFTPGSGMLTVTAPPNSKIAPPGYYMLFLVNNKGVPSVARFVLLNSTGSNPAPTVSSISPTSGPTGGGTGVTITGTGFLSGATVKVGGTAATGVNVVSSTSITATTAAHSAGSVSVVVTNTDSQNGTLNNGYTYIGPAPTVSSIAPNSGSTAGGTAVTITGTNFASGANVSIGGTAAAGVTVVNSTSITATATAHAAGAASIVVTNSDSQTGTLSNGYTYITPNPAPTVSSISPNSGPPGGGTAVTITGTGFLSGATVRVGGTAATGVTVVSSTSITATTAAHAVGAVDVVVTNADNQSATLTNGYTYKNPAPTVTTISPNSGSVLGGTLVTITGTGFLAGATVSLGGTAATGVTVVNSTSITATAPAHAAGAVSLVVTNSDLQSATLSNGYTYTSSLGLLLSGSSSATVAPGQSASYNFQIGGEGMSGTASLSCSGTPIKATCSIPTNISFNASTPTDFSVTVTTTAPPSGSLRLPASGSLALWTIGLLGMLIPPVKRASKRSSRRYLWLALLVLLMFSISCGGGGGMGGTTTTTSSGASTSTPLGTYTLTVNASVGSTTATVPLKIIVN